MSTLALTQQVASRLSGGTRITITVHENCAVVETQDILRKDVVTIAYSEIDSMEGLARQFAFHEVCVFQAVVEMLGRLAANIGAFRALAS